MTATTNDTLSPVTYMLVDIQPLNGQLTIGEDTLHTLLVITSGSANLTYEAVHGRDGSDSAYTCRLQTGSCFMLESKMCGKVDVQETEVLSGYILLFTGIRLDGLRQPRRQVSRGGIGLPYTGLLPHGEHQSEIHTAVKELYRTRGEVQSLIQMARQRKFLELLELVWSSLNEMTGESKANSEVGLPPIQHTLQCMRERYAEDLTREKLAAVAQMSPAHYSHAFRKETGQSPMDALTHIRIEAAKQLLLSKDWPLRKIAQEVGYQSEFYFSSRFKQVCGLSPSAYIKRDRRRKLATSYAHTPQVNVGNSFHSERIVGLFLEDPLIALGIKPLLQYAHTGYYQRYLSPHLYDVAKLDMAHIDYEMLHAVQPDQIMLGFSTFASSGRYERFAHIAPTTIFQQAEQDWRYSLRMLGGQIGREQAAESALDRYESLAERARGRLQKKIGGATVALLRFHFKFGLCLYGANSRYSGSVLYEDLGLEMPALLHQGLREGSESVRPISPENLLQLQADHLLLVIDESQQVLARQVMNTEVWQQLKAVKCGQVYELPTDIWMTFGILAHEHKIKQLLDAID